MKKQETITSQMDEIVFEHRNKTYGAYILRKSYNKQLIRALLLSTAILVAGLAYPLVSSYNAQSLKRHIKDDGGTVFMPIPDLPEELPPLLPPPPPSISELQKQIVFKTPIVVVGEVFDDIGLINMEDINLLSANVPVDVTKEIPVKRQEELIENPELTPPVIIVEEMPYYPGGESERQKFLADNIQYPKMALDMNLQGTVYVQFVVDSKGNITEVKILRGIGGGCDEEAARVIKMMPQWHPGKQNGKTVRVLYNMAIGFKINS